jgi:hypothetical protein
LPDVERRRHISPARVPVARRTLSPDRVPYSSDSSISDRYWYSLTYVGTRLSTQYPFRIFVFWIRIRTRMILGL